MLNVTRLAYDRYYPGETEHRGPGEILEVRLQIVSSIPLPPLAQAIREARG